jgi:hypothetical protein
MKLAGGPKANGAEAMADTVSRVSLHESNEIRSEMLKTRKFSSLGQRSAKLVCLCFSWHGMCRGRNCATTFLLRMILFGFPCFSHISSEFQDPQHTVNLRLPKVCNFSRCLSSSCPAVRALTSMENITKQKQMRKKKIRKWEKLQNFKKPRNITYRAFHGKLNQTMGKSVPKPSRNHGKRPLLTYNTL